MGSPLAFIFALGAAALYGLGNAVEHRVVSETTDDAGGLLRRLIRRPLWVFGMFGDVAAFGLQAAALAVGSLLVVQPLLVCGLLVALPLSARWTGRAIRRREWLAAIVLSASLAVFLIEAAPSGGSSHAAVASWLRVGGTTLALILAAVVVAAGTSGHVRAALLGFAAGGLFGITAALTKTFVDQIQHGVPYTAAHWEVYALAVLSLIGILLTQHGFQSASLSATLPALEATEPVVASIVGVVLLHEHLDGRSPIGDAVIAISILAVLTCVIVLAQSAGQDARLTAEAKHELDALRCLRPRHVGPQGVSPRHVAMRRFTRAKRELSDEPDRTRAPV